MADFDGGLVSSNTGLCCWARRTRRSASSIDLPLLRRTRSPLFTMHALKALVGQRVFGLASVMRISTTTTTCAAIQFWACFWASLTRWR